MNAREIQDFFDWFSIVYLAGDLEWLPEVFLYPYSAFINGDIRVEKTPADTRDYVLSRRKDLLAIGAVSMTAKVTEIGETRNARFPLQVNFIMRNSKGEAIALNTSRYLCLFDERGQLRIESVELVRISVPFLDKSVDGQLCSPSTLLV